MKTRGKTKVEVGPNDYSKDPNDSRDPMDDGTDTNGYLDEKTDDSVQGRSDARMGRTAASKRPGRTPRVGATRNRNDKHLIESAEFQEVVKGFIEFIEEINKRKGGPKKPPKPPKTPKTTDTKIYKLPEEPEVIKKHRPEIVPPQAQSIEKSEPQPEVFPTDPSKGEKNGPYRQPLPPQPSNPTRFREDITMKDIGDLLGGRGEKEQANKFSSNYMPVPGQDPKGQYNEPIRANNPKPNKPGFTGGMMDFNPYDQNLKYTPGIQGFDNPIIKQSQNNAVPQYGYENNNMLKDMMQRIQLQNFTDQNPLRGYYMQPYDNYGKMGLDNFGVNKNNELMNLQMLETLLQKNQPSLIGALLGSTPGAAALFGDLSRELPYMAQNMGLNNQRFGNQSLGVELMQSEPEALNPKTFEGKLGRAATHVAIAYFIYFKSLDPDAIAKADKSKMDPTYNARMLKEKKYENFADNSMVNKLMPQGFESRLSNLGLPSGLPLEYMGAQDLQRLLAQQGNPDQFREAQLQRLQQEVLLRNEELNQTRASYQGKSDVKQEEKEVIEAQKRRANEYREGDRNKQGAKQTQPKEEEIIEIKENSDVEDGNAETKIEVKDEKSDQKEKKNPPVEARGQTNGDDQAMKLEPTKSKEKSEENTGSFSAEDIVEEITELTNPPGFDQDKNRRGKNRRPIPTKKNSNEPVKPATQGSAQKTFADENESLVHTHNIRAEQKPTTKPAEEGKGVQVISSDEGEPQMQTEEGDAGAAKKEAKEVKPPVKQ